MLGELDQGLDRVALVLEGAKPVGRGPAGRPVEHLDGVDEGGRGAALKLHHAADIGGDDHFGLDLGDIGELPLAELPRKLGLEQIIGAGGAAAEMPLRDVQDVVAGLLEQVERQLGELLPVLERTGRVIGDAQARSTAPAASARSR